MRFFRPWFLAFVVLGIVLGGCGREATRPLSADQRYARAVMAETYQWIRDYVSPATGLPYDNARKGEFTSSTNIGFYVAAVAAAEKLGLESHAEAVARVEKCLAAVEKMENYKGWPQCWNSVETLKPNDGDPCVSTLDLGNYWAGWIVARQGLPELRDRITRHLDSMKWKDLYDPEKNLLRGGYDRKKQAFTGGWYLDMMGTDGRMAAFLAIATGDAPPSMWQNLKRTTIDHDGCSYYEPGWMGGGLFMQMISGMFLDERATPEGKAAADFAYAQMMLAQAIGSPVWGWSASDSPRDGYCGWGTLRRNVITPHASALASMYYPSKAIANLHELDKMGVRAPITVDGRKRNYGFRDAVDWQTREITDNYLILDQAMLFLSLANSFEDGVVWKLFSTDPLVAKGLTLVPELAGSEPRNLALYRRRDAEPLPRIAAAVSDSFSVLVIDDFTGKEPGKNLLGGGASTWNRDDADKTQGCVGSLVPAGAGRKGKALAIDYDVESPNAAWCGYRSMLNDRDATGANALVLDLRADAKGNPGSLKIELAGPAGVATYKLTGISTEWTRHVIPLSAMQGMNITWSRLGSLVLVFEDGRVSDKVGQLLIGRIAIEKVADTELAAGPKSGGAVTGTVEGFESPDKFSLSGWEGTTYTLKSARGRTGKALEIDYDLAQTKQWVQAERGVHWKLPPNARIAFDLNWSGKRNTVELKFIDADGSVFGTRLSDLPPPNRWSTVTIEPARFVRLWGGDETLGDVVKLSIAVSQGPQDQGGKGAIRLDNLRVEAP